MPNSKPTVDDVIEVVSLSDRARRIEDEEEILAKATRLTNGDAGDQTLQGEVLLGIAQISIDGRKISRAILAALPSLQPKSACLFNHKGVLGKMSIFGVTFKAPLVTIIVCIFAWLTLLRYVPGVKDYKPAHKISVDSRK